MNSTIHLLATFRLFAAIILILTLNTELSGQHKFVQINVIDSITKAPLPYANVFLKRSGSGASTNDNGEASLLMNKSFAFDTIYTSYVGYESKTTAINRNSAVVELSPLVAFLSEVVVTDEKPIKPIKIIKQAIKNTSLNYSTSNVLLRCLLRETVDENERYIQLNEAVIDIHYTAYPQKKLSKKIWEDWHYDECYAFDYDATNYPITLLNDFNTRDDQMKLLAKRTSLDWSDRFVETGFVGAALYLTALDKIKYRYDFFNPGVIKKYKYEQMSSEFVNGTWCYVVGFTPNRNEKKFVSVQSRKNKSPIYYGKIYIEKKSFAVVKYDYELAVERDFGFFAGRMPLSFRVSVDYKKENDLWRLNEIILSTTRSIGVDKKGQSILHTGKRRLNVLNQLTDNVRPFLDSIEFKSTRYTSIRYFPMAYDSLTWSAYELDKSHPLDKKIKLDLERKMPLEKQFRHNYGDVGASNYPKPDKSYHAFEYHNEYYVDSLHWMADSTNDLAFRSFLAKENEFTKGILYPSKKVQRELFNSANYFKRIEDTTEVAHKVGSYYYDRDTLEELILYHQVDSVRRTICLNLSDFISEHPKASVSKVSPNNTGDKIFVSYNIPGELSDRLAIYSTLTHQLLDRCQNVYTAEWYSGESILYTRTDALGRSGALVHYDLNQRRDSVLYIETDSTFDVEIKKQERQLFCSVQSSSENEVYFVDSTANYPTLKLIQKRKRNVEYNIKKSDDYYMLTNEFSSNNTLMRSSTSFPFNWQSITSDLSDYYIFDFSANDQLVALNGFSNANSNVKYKLTQQKKWNSLPIPYRNANLSLSKLTLNSISVMVSSPTLSHRMMTYRIDEKVRLEQEKEVNKYNKKIPKHNIKRLWAKSKDGVKVPITFIKGMKSKRDGKSVILKVYGAYGANTIPSFSSDDLALIKRGYSIAYAHVRGELVLGHDWYGDGKLLNKKNTFMDYIACAQFLIAQDLCDSDKLVAYGNSAGGLVVGWAINEYPELFNTAILDHPYLDVVNTMMNKNLPLTIGEYKEWGNPNERITFDYINSYSPYQNIRKQNYPHLIFLSGYLDFQTPAWQVAKHVTRIRENNTADTKVVLLTDMNSGHSGARSDKAWMKKFARVYSFVDGNVFLKEAITNPFEKYFNKK